jgi:hypothetical protein
MANGLTPFVNMPAPVQCGPDYRMVFEESFYELDIDFHRSTTVPHKWVEGVWYDAANPSAVITAANGVGTITWTNGQTPPNTTMKSFQDFRYGYFEARFQFDNVNGAWPGFWLLASESLESPSITSGEFDMFEWVSANPTQETCTIHEWGAGGNQLSFNKATFIPSGSFDWTAYHTWGFHWTPFKADLYCDNVLFGSVTIPTTCDYQHYYVMLTMNAGINFCNSPSCLAEITASDISMRVEWVRVWQNQIMVEKNLSLWE